MVEFLSRLTLILIILTYSVITLALFEQLSLVIVVFGLCCVIWRTALFYRWINSMRPLLLTLVSILATILTVGLVYQQGIFNIMLHIIFLGFSLKFLELKSVRDVYFFVNTGFILVALFFIFNTSISATFMVALLTLLLLAVLLSLHTKSISTSVSFRLLIKSSLLSLPLALLLFVVMPRLPTLWQVPVQKQATTGLSDTVTPGDIANLSRSSALAFRATFKGQVPSVNERYWRAMTLDYFDGKTWSQSKTLKDEELQVKRRKARQSLASKPIKKSDGQIKTEYELIIEPHYNHWVPVLDYALQSDDMVSLSDFSLRSQQPVVTRESITVAQFDKVQYWPLSSQQLSQFTQLPKQTIANKNSQTNAWIKENLRKGLTKLQVLDKLLKDFSIGFRYTLTPPLLSENHVDDFLFNSKAGFCVHFASSYLYVARQLGIPARMVTGYLGGEWQQTEGFFIIRQYDAHAWVEIWHNGQWERVDPTAYVASERVQSGLQAGLTDGNEFLAGQYFSLQKWRSVAFINELRGRLAQIDYLWARYVVNFDSQSQIKLMQKWAKNLPWLTLSYGIMFLMVMIFLVLLLFIFKPWQVKRYAQEDKIYLTLQQYYKKRGYERTKGQSVSDYFVALSLQFNVPIPMAEDFSRKYNEIKYQPNLSREAYKKRIKQLALISKKIRGQ